MRTVVVVILVALFFPMYGKVLPFLSSLPFHFANYGIVLLSLSLLFVLTAQTRIRLFPVEIRPLLLFCLYLMALMWFHAITSGIMQESITRAQGVTMGLLAVLLLYQTSFPKRSLEFLNYFVFLFGLLFMGQVLISAYESASGTLLGEYEIAIYGVVVEERDPLALVGGDLASLLGFQVPLTGMLGQHNAYGNMLVFCNMIFVMHYVYTRSRYSLVLLSLVVFACLGNTTRITLFAVILTDVFIVAHLLGGKVVKRLIYFGVIMPAIVFAIVVIASPDLVFSDSNSMLFRFELWDYAWRHFSELLDFRRVVFGFDPAELRLIGIGFTGRMLGSFENQYLALLFQSGLLGLSLFLYAFFFYLISRSKTTDRRASLLMKLLVFNIMVCGLTLDVHLHYSSFVLISIIFAWLLSRVRMARQAAGQLLTGARNSGSADDGKRPMVQ